MTTFNYDLRLTLLEGRVGELEACLRRRGLLDPAGGGVQTAEAVWQDTTPSHGAKPYPAASVEAVTPQAIFPLTVPHAQGEQSGSPVVPRSSVLPPPLPAGLGRKAELLQYPRAQKPGPIPQGDLEKTIGLKWAGWIGALVFVIGAALGVKYAYDRGWLTDLIPDWMWLGLIVSAGFALIAAGEWVYRRVNPLSAAGLFAAGVATLFVASYSGHAYYEIYSQSVAFTCMAISALVGAAVAIRGNMVSIAVVSLLGANIAPILLGDRNAPVSSFLTYLFATQIVALLLAARGQGGKWWTLRGLSLGSIVFWMLSVLPEHENNHAVLVFTLVFAVVYQLELIVTNFRQDQRTPARRGEAAGLAFSMLVTAGLTAAMIWLHHRDGSVVQTAWILGIAGVCGALGLSLPSIHRPALTDLATGYALQAIALVFVAVPVYTEGMNVEIGWAVLAVGLALIGVLGKKDVSRLGSMIAWGLAVIHLFARNGDESIHAVLTTMGGVEIHSNAVLALALAVLGQFIAVLAAFRKKEGPIVNAIGAVSATATFVWCVTALIEFSAGSATLLVLAFAWGLLGISKLLPETIGQTQGIVLLTGGAVKWLVLDAIGPALVTRPAPLPVMLNSVTLSACILIATAIAFIWMTPKLTHTEKAAHDLRLTLKLAIALIGLVDLSVEISRWFDNTGASIGLNDPHLAKQVALSIFWACFAVASVGVGFATREAALRYLGLILLAVTLMKVVTVDLSGVSQGYRVLSFIGVGLLMLGTSVLYGKVSPKLLADERLSDG